MAGMRIGLTGGIAAGKSTVAKWMRQAGLVVVDADRLVAGLYHPDGEGSAVIERLFGPSYLDDDGGVRHARVAARVFADPPARRQLEAEIHPLVKHEFEAIAAETTGIVVLEAPLLVEAGFASDMDLVVTVEADPDTRLRRAIERGLDATEARRRMDAQSSEATRVDAAHRILRNDGSLEELREEVDNLVADIRTLAGHRG